MWVDLGNILEVQLMEIDKNIRKSNLTNMNPSVLISINRLTVVLIKKLQILINIYLKKSLLSQIREKN